MKIKNIKIGTQLIIGFATILSFVIMLGIVAYVQTYQLHRQTENMYNHPIQVKRAISALNIDILTIYINDRNLMIAKTYNEKQSNIQKNALNAVDAEKQFDIIKALYLGPVADVEECNKNYILWQVANQEHSGRILARDILTVEESLLIKAESDIYIEKMLAAIDKMDKFSSKKADDLYLDSVKLKATMDNQLLGMIATILLISLIISYIVLLNIRKPLKEMTDAVLRFHEGDMDSRSFYRSKNEFGILSSSINDLVGLVQKNTNINKTTANITEVMLSKYDARKFFQGTLGALAEHTESQIAAVYLLSNDQKNFDHFESIGMGNLAKGSFAADCFEGEFGAALLSHKFQYIQNIPEDTRFVFHTVNGKFIPREIITIPIISDNQVIAIISLATISKFASTSIDLIGSITSVISARIEGILAYRRIQDFVEEVEKQNCELTAHKSELSAQTAELMQNNAELEMQKKQLDEASRLKTNFLSNMSHELRTPLNSVIALSGVLNRRLANQIPEEEYSYLEIIERNGKNLLMLINDVLDISRIESGHEEIEITEFNANNLIADVVEMIQPQAKQKNIELIHELRNFNLFISCDNDKCSHILQNLIGNAVKFTEKGNVVISAEQSKNSIEIKVKDTGIGISEDHLPHIFDEFRQADGSTSRRFGGTGLGLTIAKKYANLLGGTISVKSTIDEGSEFILSLPLHYVAENKIVEEERKTDFKYEINHSPLKSTSNSSYKTILLVEDNESAIIQIRDLVEEMGHKVLVAQDASAAFGIIDQVIPDAIILDLMMPEIDGFKALEIIRNAEPTAHIPVLILTAKHITKEELKLLKRNNIHQLIQKGDVNRIKLQNSVSNMLFPETLKVKQAKKIYMPIEGKPVVLIVEDNQDNMITIRAILADLYTIIEAVNGDEGIEMAKEYVPNLILMDIALPGKNGIETFKEIRNIPKLEHISVVALTASALDHEREAILSHGFDAFIAKPIMAEQFHSVISEVLYGK
jgi:signal transduction histidine kinase/CheY-like chemotaxis protein